MTSFVNPWVILGIVLAFIGVGTGAYIKGGTDAMNREQAQAAREEHVAQIAYEAGLRGTAKVVSEIEITHTTIQQKAKEIIREQTVYRDCVADPELIRLLDNARANLPASLPAGDSKLSSGSTAGSTH